MLSPETAEEDRVGVTPENNGQYKKMKYMHNLNNISM